MKGNITKSRSCAYCGKSDCRCKYRYGRLGGYSIAEQSTMRESTVAEFRSEFEKYTKDMKPEAHVAWMWSVTKIDEAKMVKSDEKRQAKKIAERIMGAAQ